MNSSTRVGVISIIVEDTEKTDALNDLLHQYRQYIIGRMGIPYRVKNISIISVALDAPQDVISAMSGRIGNLGGIKVKSVVTNV